MCQYVCQCSVYYYGYIYILSWFYVGLGVKPQCFIDFNIDTKLNVSVAVQFGSYQQLPSISVVYLFFDELFLI